MPTAALLEGNRYEELEAMSRQDGTLNKEKYRRTEIWPEAPTPNIPDGIPGSVARVLVQAESNFAQAGNEEAAATMYRKSLELALKDVDATLTGTLAAKIQSLGAQHKLTPSLVDWAHEVRLLGNFGAHEDEAISRSDLEALRDFVDLILRYLFTLPSLLEKRRAKQKSEP
jgi:hypothetical protein